jgi:hypothetical protein
MSSNPDRRAVFAALATAALPAMPALAQNPDDYDDMAIEVVLEDYAAGGRYPVDRAMLSRIADGLRANGVTWRSEHRIYTNTGPDFVERLRKHEEGRPVRRRLP